VQYSYPIINLSIPILRKKSEKVRVVVPNGTKKQTKKNEKKCAKKFLQDDESEAAPEGIPGI
jgi:hypothetical protein